MEPKIERLSTGTFKITDENGRITYSDTLPQPSTTTNQAKGVVVTLDPTGQFRIRTDENGNLLGVDGAAAAKKKKQKELMEGLRAQGEAMKQAAEEAEAYKANQDKWGGVGVHGGVKVTLPDGRVVFEIKNEVGHIPTDTSLGTDVDVGGAIKRKTGTEDVPTPGLSIGGGVSISATRQEKLGMSEGQRAFALKVQEAKEEFDKAKEEAMETARTDPQAANDKFNKDMADIFRKYGKEAAEAAIK